MRIGFIVDGDAEYYSIKQALDRVDTHEELLSPRRADIQPLAPTPQIVRSVKARVIELAAKGADRVIVLLDLENRAPCAGPWATALRGALLGGCAGCGVGDLRVVLKKRMYENWLVGDPAALQQMPSRFSLTPGVVASIVPNKADQIDALSLLKAAVKKGQYDKVDDARRIMARADPMQVGRNSRSFRKLLQLIGSPAYAAQTLHP